MATFISISGPSVTGKTSLIDSLCSYRDMNKFSFSPDFKDVVWHELTDSGIFSDFTDITSDPSYMCTYLHRLVDTHNKYIESHMNDEGVFILDECWLDYFIYALLSMWYSRVISGAQEEVFNKIKDIYIFDAPGLPDSLIEEKRWKKIESITHSFIPSSSVIGMLFNTTDNAVVVKSSSLGLLQHDAFTWLLSGGKFITQPDITYRSHKIDSTVKNFIKMLDKNERETLVEVLYKVLKATEEENVWLMPEAAAKRFPEIKKAIAGLSVEEKKTLTSILITLEKARIETRRSSLNGWK